MDNQKRPGQSRHFNHQHKIPKSVLPTNKMTPTPVKPTQITEQPKQEGLRSESHRVWISHETYFEVNKDGYPKKGDYYEGALGIVLVAKREGKDNTIGVRA